MIQHALLASLLPLGCLAAACTPAAAAPADPGAPPARLEDTGLWSDPARHLVAPDVLPYEPQYPLWTDGATKRRWIRIPRGTAIDASDPDRWVFPAGTELWKEFSFGRPVETRYLRLGADGTWLFATYLWDADGKEAVLAPERGVKGLPVGLGGAPYDVPGRGDCRLCHAAGPTTVLGFDALQLSPDRDPLAPHAQHPAPGAVDLPALVARGLLVHLPERLLAEPPRVPARSPRERAVLGYLSTNCGVCHSDQGALAQLGLSFAIAFGHHESGFASFVGRPAVGCGDPGDRPLRVAPGDPDASLLVRRMAARDPVQAMPPLGSRVPDADALALVRAWIAEDLTTPSSHPSSDPDAVVSVPRSTYHHDDPTPGGASRHDPR